MLSISEKAKIIDDLIREDKDVRVCDYLELIKEIERIQTKNN